MTPKISDTLAGNAFAAGEASAPDLMRAIIATATDAIIAVDPEQRIVLFNPAAEAMFRCSAAQALGQPLGRFLPPGLRAAHHRHVVAFAATGDTARAMSRLRPLVALRANGEEFPIEATISRVEIAGQIYAASILRDITLRHQHDAALQHQAELLDLADDAIFSWEWEGQIIYWNRGAERLYGYTREEAIGQNGHALLRTRFPKGIETVLSTLQREGTWEGELTHTSRDGRESIVAARLKRVDDAAEERLVVLEIARDLTAWKAVEAAETQSRQREAIAQAAATAAASARDHLREILDALQSGVMLMSEMDTRIEFANAAMRELIFGSRRCRSTPPAYGRDFTFARYDGIELSPNERPAARAFAGKRVEHQQLLLRRPDGTTQPVEVFATVLATGDAGPGRAVISVHDLSRLVQAEQFKDDFLLLVSHELRTPLTAIHGGASLLLNKPHLDADERRELLRDVVAESERLERLLSNLLLVTEVVGGRLRVSTEPVPIAPLARTIAKELADRNPNHTFLVAAGPKLAIAEADPSLVEEILRNLYENAVKYSPCGGMIRTEIEEAADRAVIRVRDEGIGIAPEHVASVFERFRRVGGDPHVRGMGLGLYLSRALAEAQQGEISASSPGVGLGATFTVTLPAAHDRDLFATQP